MGQHLWEVCWLDVIGFRAQAIDFLIRDVLLGRASSRNIERWRERLSERCAGSGTQGTGCRDVGLRVLGGGHAIAFARVPKITPGFPWMSYMGTPATSSAGWSASGRSEPGSLGSELGHWGGRLCLE